MSDETVVVVGGEDPPPAPVPVVVDAGSDTMAAVERAARLEEHESRHAEAAAMAEERHAGICERLDAHEGRLMALETRDQEPPSAAAREDALEDLAVVGEVIADVVEATTEGPDVEPPPSTTNSAGNDGAAADETMVVPDNSVGDGTGTGTVGPVAEPTRRKKSGWW